MEEKERSEIDEKNEEVDLTKHQVWSWGAGTDGQLGTRKLQDEHLPQLLHSLSSVGSISVLSCGGAHVIALTPCGKVLTWGRGTSGQLGHGDMVNSLQPKLVDFFDRIVITQVSAGWSHSGFVSDSGCLFTCGDGSFGQLGHGDYNSLAFPKLVSHFENKHVLQIACGLRHSIVLLKGDSRREIYGFGSGKRGQLGVSKDKIKSICVPQVTFGVENIEFTSITANGDHSGALSDNGHLYLWGRGFLGKKDSYHPRHVSSRLRFIQVALGWNHVLALTDDGQVFMLDGYYYGVSSDPHNMSKSNDLSSCSTLMDDTHEDSSGLCVKKVRGLDGMKVVQIVAGSEHSALVTENGVVMAWGWGEHGQLGLGNTLNQATPQAVALGQELSRRSSSMVRAYCGSGFTFSLKVPNNEINSRKFSETTEPVS